MSNGEYFIYEIINSPYVDKPILLHTFKRSEIFAQEGDGEFSAQKFKEGRKNGLEKAIANILAFGEFNFCAYYTTALPEDYYAIQNSLLVNG